MDYDFDFEMKNINNISIRQDAVVHACDKAIISRESYRMLTNIYPDLERYYRIEARRIEIQNIINNLVPIKTFFVNDTNNNNNQTNNNSQTANNSGFGTSFINENTNMEMEHIIQ